MRTLRIWVLAMGAALVLAQATPASARSLARQLGDYITQGFQGPDTITPLITRLGAQGTDFPVPPTTPGYVFVYNAEQGIFERFDGSLGPVFLERVDTLGQNHFSFGFSYLYGNVNQFDGSDLAQGNATATGVTAIPPGGVDPVTVGTFLDDFDLPTHKVNFAASYGITDDLDVGFLLPLVGTSVKAKGRRFAVDPGFRQQRLPELDESSTGVGDLLLRAKYRFGYLWDWGIGGGLVVRAPTGDEEDFHGFGNWTVQPLLIISRAFGVQDVHANLGMEFDVEDSTRTRARYGIGATLAHPDYRWLALLLDFVGTSGLDDEQFTTTATFTPGTQPRAIFAPFLTSATVNGRTVTAVSTIPRSDQFNAAVGLKFELAGNLIGYLNAIVPITRQGLQANVIPVGGLEYSF